MSGTASPPPAPATPDGGTGRPPLALAAALRAALRSGYDRARLAADLSAGLTVGIVALPLSMALAIACGVAPEHGLYTAIVAGAVTAVLGGSRVQVSGPTAAFVVVLAPVVSRFGFQGLALASLMAGLLLVLFAFARLGRIIQLVPYPVTSGFTAGIAIVIASLQLRDFLGLHLESLPEHGLERLAALLTALPGVDPATAAVGAGTLALLLIWPRLSHRVPAPLVALAVAAAAVALLEALVPGFDVVTIADRFSYSAADGLHAGVPRTPPGFAWPWSWPGAGGAAVPLDFALLRELAGPAFAIALLGAIESLLSAVVADGMTGLKHDPDGELLGQGLGNVAAAFFGGFAATGAIARTATNVRAGGRSPIASVVHAVFLLLAMLLFAPLLGFVPMAALAALLLTVAWNMSHARHVVHSLRTSPRSDALVLLTCLGLTVAFDMVLAITVGVVLASLLFMKRMIEVSAVRLLPAPAASDEHPPDASILVYEIAGPLFFGAAERAMSALERVHADVRTIVIDLRAVPAMDATGVVNLRSALERLKRSGTYAVIAGLQQQPGEVLDRAGVAGVPDELFVAESFEEGLRHARERTASEPGARASS